MRRAEEEKGRGGDAFVADALRGAGLGSAFVFFAPSWFNRQPGFRSVDRGAPLGIEYHPATGQPPGTLNPNFHAFPPGYRRGLIPTSCRPSHLP